MKTWRHDGRMFEPVLEASAHRQDGTIELRAPAVGRWRGQPAPGTLVVPEASLGELEILGVMHRVVAPAGAAGVVTDDVHGPRPGEVALAHGDAMLILDPEGAVAAGREVAAAAQAGDRQPAQGLVFPSPLSGRFYARPAPDAPAFVEPGDIVGTGQTVALLEVMKTFNRITYGGSGLPERARIVEVVPRDEDDLEAGDPLLRLEPVTE